MPSASVTARAAEINKYIRLLDQWWKSQEDDGVPYDTQNIGAEYIIVISYGMVESEMQKMLEEYVEANSNSTVHKAMKESINRIYSWNYPKIKTVFKQFNENWLAAVKSQLNREQKVAINQLCKIRNCIAHGSSHYVSFEDAEKYFNSAVEGLHIIYEIINNDE